MRQETHSGISVLIVDDDDFFRAQLQSWVKKDPRFRCVGSCSNGDIGLEEICSKKPSLAIVDLGLPGLHGVEVLWRTREQAPSVKLLAVAGLPDDHLVLEALEAGAHGFLEKPLQRETFFTSIDEILSGNHPLSIRARTLLVQRYRSLRPNPGVISELSNREKEVAKLVFVGMSDEAIGRALGISTETVRWHEKNIHYKLQVHCRAELQIKLLGLGQP